VEEHAALSEHSKALAIFPRTMEIFDMAGVVGPVLEKANCVTEVSVMRHGNRIAHMRFAPNNPFVFSRLKHPSHFSQKYEEKQWSRTL
jgi:hypothetical protein